MDNIEGIKVGDKLEMHCYKHNGNLHKKWDEAVVLDIFDDYTRLFQLKSVKSSIFY